jgi:hypothetical protein
LTVNNVDEVKLALAVSQKQIIAFFYFVSVRAMKPNLLFSPQQDNIGSRVFFADLKLYSKKVPLSTKIELLKASHNKA